MRGEEKREVQRRRRRYGKEDGAGQASAPSRICPPKYCAMWWWDDPVFPPQLLPGHLCEAYPCFGPPIPPSAVLPSGPYPPPARCPPTTRCPIPSQPCCCWCCCTHQRPARRYPCHGGRHAAVSMLAAVLVAAKAVAMTVMAVAVGWRCR